MEFKLLQLIPLLLLSFFQSSCFAYVIDKGEGQIDEKILFPNREHKVFNAIGSALRTEASAANPNGMSVFLTYVDQGSILFHGTRKEKDVVGFEWVSFDPNFAALFGRVNVGKNPNPPHQPPSEANLYFQGQQTQIPLQSTGTNNEKRPKSLGNLRTYTPKRKLRLLYLDGLSAVKRDNGSLDFQDSVLLFNRSIPAFADYHRAKKLCELKRNRWKNKIDGFIRKDFEFEIIVCDFEKDLQELDRVYVPDIDFDKEIVWIPDWYTNILPNEAKDDTITRPSVQINYDSIVSVWNHPIDVFPQQSFNNSDIPLPRLNKISREERDMLLANIDRLILGDDDDTEFINWQEIIDAIVARYRPVFKAFEVDLEDDMNKKLANKTAFFSVFLYVDILNRSREKEMQRCTNHLYKIPERIKDNPTLVSNSVQTVLQALCSTMLDIHDEKDIFKSQKRLKHLSKILYWTPWLRHQRKRIEPWSIEDVLS